MNYALSIKDSYDDWYFMPFDDLESLSNFIKDNKFYLKRIPDYMIIKYITFTYDEVVIDD